MESESQRLRHLLSRREKIRLLVLTILKTSSALVEIATLYITFLILPTLFATKIDQTNNFTLQFFEKKNTNFLIGALLASAALKIATLTITLYFERQLREKISLKLSQNLYKLCLTVPYEDFIAKDSAYLLRNIQDAYLVVERSIFSRLNLVAESTFFFGLMALITISLPIQFSIGSVFALSIGFVFLKWNSKITANYGKQYDINSKNSMLVTQQGLRLGKEIRVFKAQDSFLEKFKETHSLKLNALLKSDIFQQITPHALEFLLIIVASAAIFFTNNSLGSDSERIESLSILLIGALRAIPSIGKINGNFQALKFGSAGLLDLMNDLERETKTSTVFKTRSDLNLTSRIKFESVSFHYADNSNSPVFSNANLSFETGKIHALVGSNGSGKTTLLNLILGLLSPTSGQIVFSGRSVESNDDDFSNNIGYVPQVVTLLNSNIIDNVSFGRKDIPDFETKLANSIKDSGLEGLLNSFDNGLLHLIGENGNKLSGGEQKKIGIARAILLEPPILVLDEVSNFLDENSIDDIKVILKNLKSRHCIIIATHDNSLLEISDQIFHINSNGRITLTA